MKQDESGSASTGDPIVDELLAAFRDMAPTEVTPFFENGFYVGSTVRYRNGMEMFHTYIPLTITGVLPNTKNMDATNPGEWIGRFPTEIEYWADKAKEASKH